MSHYKVKMQNVCDFINHNLENELSLQIISEFAGISKYHFHRLFTSYLGITLTNYIQLQRLKRASYRLVFNKDMKIIDIAFEAKFESHEVFSRVFKKTFSLTPIEFRNHPDWESWHNIYNFNLNREGNRMEVKIIDFTETKIAVLEYSGKPELLNQKIPQFIAWRKSTGLSPVNSNRTFGIAYNDPNNCAPDEFRFDICGEIKNDITSNEFGVIQKTIPSGRCAVIRHLGSRDNMEVPVYYLYRTWLAESGHQLRNFPLYFEYKNLFPETPEAELVTDIFLPLM